MYCNELTCSKLNCKEEHEWQWIEAQFPNRENKVYKHVWDRIIEFKAPPQETTNERRKVVNSDFAKYRAKHALVLRILNYKTRKWETEYLHSYLEHDVLYKVDQLALPNGWSDDIDTVCGRGIHYFKSLQGAYLYWRQELIRFSNQGEVEAIRKSHLYRDDYFTRCVCLDRTCATCLQVAYYSNIFHINIYNVHCMINT